eukprot:PhF_6_TR2523/c0_g1_i2/m.4285
MLRRCYFRHKIDLWNKLLTEKNLRNAMKRDPNLAARLENMTPQEKHDETAKYSPAAAEGAGGTVIQSTYTRAEQRFQERAMEEEEEQQQHSGQHSGGGGEDDEAFQTEMRRMKALIAARELGFAQRAARNFKRAFNTQQNYVTSQTGRYVVVDVVRNNNRQNNNMTTTNRKASSCNRKGLFLG